MNVMKELAKAIAPAVESALIQSTIILLHEMIKVLEEKNKRIVASEH